MKYLESMRVRAILANSSEYARFETNSFVGPLFRSTTSADSDSKKSQRLHRTTLRLIYSRAVHRIFTGARISSVATRTGNISEIFSLEAVSVDRSYTVAGKQGYERFRNPLKNLSYRSY